MNINQRTQISKRLSFILRHRPDSIGIQLDDQGWIDIHHLLEGLALDGHSISMGSLREVVETSPKKRFELSSCGSMIRARQGHSVRVDLGYTPVVPPDVLYHGTPSSNVDSILSTGINKGRRHHVHLSTDQGLMLEVARRRGKPVLVQVDSANMHLEGYEFFVTENDVWLTEFVPPEYVRYNDDS